MPRLLQTAGLPAAIPAVWRQCLWSSGSAPASLVPGGDLQGHHLGEYLACRVVVDSPAEGLARGMQIDLGTAEPSVSHDRFEGDRIAVALLDRVGGEGVPKRVWCDPFDGVRTGSGVDLQQQFDGCGCPRGNALEATLPRRVALRRAGSCTCVHLLYPSSPRRGQVKLFGSSSRPSPTGCSSSDSARISQHCPPS